MKLLGIEYDNLTVKEALEAIINLIESRQKANVFFLNADCLYKAQKDKEYRSILQAANLVLSDGLGLRLATKIFGGSMKDNCNGTDLSPKILEEAVKRDWSVFFLGGKDGLAKKAAQNIQLKFPSLKIVGTSPGYFGNDREVIHMINEAAPDILFVAMGVPLQEKWIFRNRAFINARLCLGVGALLGYLSGTILRAPLWVRQAHIEWFWRIFIDPKRMFKRYIVDGFCFFMYVIYIRLTKKNL
jgi:N-acetylglucosaminyldiphosphoundecaprenol N-acetyl-beta-D-mannosaminyltransferase